MTNRLWQKIVKSVPVNRNTTSTYLYCTMYNYSFRIFINFVFIGWFNVKEYIFVLYRSGKINTSYGREGSEYLPPK